MIRVIFLFLSVALAQEIPPNLTQWMHAVEEIVAHLTLGPLKETFTPEYVANRTMEFVLRKQTNHFRARVATAIVECTTDEARICIDHQTNDKVVKSILGEVKDHGFEAFWLHEMDECFGKSGLLVKVPPPSLPIIKE